MTTTDSPKVFHITKTRSIRYGSVEDGDKMFAYLSEANAIVKLTMQVESGGLEYPIEIATASMQPQHIIGLLDDLLPGMQPQHIIGLLDDLLPGMQPVERTAEITWEDDF